MYDVIVVGAGIFGRCAAYHSQRLGLKTLLLEQFAINHTNGSSHGMSRIIRYAHTDKPYIPLVADTYQQIEELEKKRDEKLWLNSGLLWVAPIEEVNTISENLKSNNLDHDVIKGSEIVNKYPQFSYTDDYNGLIDPKGGVIYANKWMDAFYDEYQKLGGQSQFEEELISYEESGDQTTIKTNKNQYESKKVIITVGAWIGSLLPQLKFRIQPTSIAVCYWKTKEEKDTKFTYGEHFPVFIGKNQQGFTNAAAMSSVDYPGAVKVYTNDGRPIGHGQSHPSEQPTDLVNYLSRYIEKHIPMLDHTAPVAVDCCKYTMSEDEHYVIDYLPNHKNVLVGGCGSGSGFKVAPTIGKVLAEMAAGRPTSVDASFFSLKRFN